MNVKNYIENEWTHKLRSVGLNDAQLLSNSNEDLARRTYVKSNLLYKIILKKFDTSNEFRNQTLANELDIVAYCKGIKGIPEAIEYREEGDIEIAVYKYIPFKSLKNIRVQTLKDFFVLLRLTIILLQLSRRGICHNDIMPKNILISKDSKPFLIDFDQAILSKPIEAFLRNIFCLAYVILESNKNNFILDKIKLLLKKYISPNIFEAIRNIRNKVLMRPKRQLPKIPNDTNQQVKLLYEAWRLAQISNANAPGKMLSYYSLDFHGYHFPGERPWFERWRIFKQITEFRNKRILELGCNIGILSCFLLKESEASEVLAVDHDPTILEAAKKFAIAMNASPKFLNVDFDNKDDWESKLINFMPDIVFALSVLNWINDKNRFLTFLGNFQEIIFEGHDSVTVETKRFKGIGFNKVKVVAISERKRPVLHCIK